MKRRVRVLEKNVFGERFGSELWRSLAARKDIVL